MTQSPPLRLSICIGTFNRARFIGATIENIIAQSTSDCEIVVSDNASTDNTEEVVCAYSRCSTQLRYFRQDTNKGLDSNYDHAVSLARGEYCWLMSDDDLLKPGAVARVLKALRMDLSLILVNVEYRNHDMSKVLQPRMFGVKSDRTYGREEMDELFSDADDGLWYIGSVILKRAIWLAREKERYYGSLFIHVAVVFQEVLPAKALVIAEPLISYRMGNTNSYSPQMIEILFVKWPLLVESLAVSEVARRKSRSAEPWRHPKWLLVLRGWGLYSLTEYGSCIRPRLNSILERLVPILVAVLPGILVNTLLTLYYLIRQDRGRELQWMRQSRFHLKNALGPKRDA